MSVKPEKKLPALAKRAAERYIELTGLRATVQLIPYIGGSLDTLLAGEGAKIQQKRVEHLLAELNRRLRLLQPPSSPVPEEELLDLMLGVFERAIKTRSEQKRSHFAQIVAKQIVTGGGVTQAEVALRLVGELDDLHIKILKTALLAPIIPNFFDGRRVITLAAKPATTPGGKTSLQLAHVFPDVPVTTLRLACSELVSRGLFQDEGIGRWDLGVMEYFVPTDLGAWLYGWIKSSEQE